MERSLNKKNGYLIISSASQPYPIYDLYITFVSVLTFFFRISSRFLMLDNIEQNINKINVCNVEREQQI